MAKMRLDIQDVKRVMYPGRYQKYQAVKTIGRFRVYVPDNKENFGWATKFINFV